MRHIVLTLVSLVALAAISSGAQAEMKTIEVAVSFRERIALPPDAELDVQLLDVSRADAATRRIASQRFVFTAVPMTVTLIYDPQIIDDQARYAVVAGIWSGNDQIFRTLSLYNVLGGSDADAVDVLLTMVTGHGDIAAPPRSISGIQWAVTEVAGQAWSNDDPATLVIDDRMNFSIFGGCNRFNGQLILTEDEIALPENFAGTLMACPPETEALERSFLAALRNVSRYVRYGAGLVMTDADGNALLHFVERPE